MCGIGNWKCPYKDSYDYYVKLNKKDEIIETSLNNNFKNTEGFKIETRRYDGCPKFKGQTKKSDDFLE